MYFSSSVVSSIQFEIQQIECQKPSFEENIRYLDNHREVLLVIKGAIKRTRDCIHNLDQTPSEK